MSIRFPSFGEKQDSRKASSQPARRPVLEPPAQEPTPGVSGLRLFYSVWEIPLQDKSIAVSQGDSSHRFCPRSPSLEPGSKLGMAHFLQVFPRLKGSPRRGALCVF